MARRDLSRAMRRGLVEAASFVTVARAGLVGFDPPQRARRLVRSYRDYGVTGATIGMAAARHGEAIALVDELGPISFSALDRDSNSFANALRDDGLPPGVCVAILCRNHRWLLDALFGCAKLGARTVFLNTDFAGPQLHDVCTREGVDVLIHDEEFTAVVGDYQAKRGQLVAWTDSESGTAPTVASLIARGAASNPPKPAQRQQVVMLTSGTTGIPKGAPRHFGMSMVIPGGLLSKIPYRPTDTIYVAPPMFHGWGLLNAVTALGLGARMVTARRFKPEAVLDSLAAERCTALAVVPIMLARILAIGAEEIAAHDLSALRIVSSGGSQLSGPLATEAMDTFGDIVYNLYGSTEVAFASIATPADLRAAPGCAGKPPYGTTVRILDADGYELPTGTIGRIFVANGAEFSGYTGGGNKEVINGLMSSGDVGHFDAAGRLFVDGRDDEMIISGGENVYPREVEELLAGHPAVYEAAVIGVPDSEYGARLEAYVVLAEPGALTESAARDYVRDNLARYKVPRAVVFVDELPHNPTGKILKRELYKLREASA